jgi:hypothetical protein
MSEPTPGRSPVVIPAIVVAVLVLVGVGVGVWWFAAGPGHRVSPQPIAAAGPSSAPPQSRVPVRSPSTLPPTSRDTASAYDVGTCFDEQAGSAQGKVELNPVECGGDQAVFVINKVVTSASDCDSDASVSYGHEVPDETANVTYCASLVVPVDICFTLGGSMAIATAPCGSGPNVVQVLSIESAPNVGSACTDKTDPDVWFYQSPTSGQYACVSRPAITAVPTAPTTTPAG